VSVPRMYSSLGDRALAVAAPRAWNSLPLSLRATVSADCFTRNFKTFLTYIMQLSFLNIFIVYGVRRPCCAFRALYVALILTFHDMIELSLAHDLGP